MRWAFLDPTPEREHFTLRQLRLTLEREGHTVQTIRSMDGTHLKTPHQIDEALSPWKPQRILWCSEAGLPYYELWTNSRWSSVPKIALWFDEPVTPVEHFGLDGVMRHTAERPDFFHGIWDGYWRDRAKELWGIPARAIHLSADEKEYHPSAGERDHPDAVVFIGMLHREEMIRRHLQELPRGLKSLSAIIQDRLGAKNRYRAKEEEPVPCWDRLWSDAEKELHPKERILLESERRENAHAVWCLRWAGWAMAKNAVRVRILRKALEVAPLRIYCEQKQLGHAREAEWRDLLGTHAVRLQIEDTSRLTGEELPRLHHEGALHLQATDPQSVRGGIPYRVFQTAASGRALLTDLRPELTDAFVPGKEILGYTSPNNLVSALTKALADRDHLETIGRAARSRFEQEHRWSHRLQTMEAWIRAAGSPLQ